MRNRHGNLLLGLKIRNRHGNLLLDFEVLVYGNLLVT